MCPGCTRPALSPWLATFPGHPSVTYCSVPPAVRASQVPRARLSGVYGCPWPDTCFQSLLCAPRRPGALVLSPTRLPDAPNSDPPSIYKSPRLAFLKGTELRPPTYSGPSANLWSAGDGLAEKRGHCARQLHCLPLSKKLPELSFQPDPPPPSPRLTSAVFQDGSLGTECVSIGPLLLTRAGHKAASQPPARPAAGCRTLSPVGDPRGRPHPGHHASLRQAGPRVLGS